MDVIALHQAGFTGAVAPLGTALTDGADGGAVAARRRSRCSASTATRPARGPRRARRELALPLLAPERSLRLATLPGGEDPDTLVVKGGPGAFQAVLDAARPLGDALYGLLAEGVPAQATPEQRAALRNRLADAAALIPDKRAGGRIPPRAARPLLRGRRRGPAASRGRRAARTASAAVARPPPRRASPAVAPWTRRRAARAGAEPDRHPAAPPHVLTRGGGAADGPRPAGRAPARALRARPASHGWRMADALDSAGLDGPTRRVWAGGVRRLGHRDVTGCCAAAAGRAAQGGAGRLLALLRAAARRGGTDGGPAAAERA